MASRSGACRTTLVVRLGSRSRKGVVGLAPPLSRSDSKFNKLGALEKGIPAPSHASTPFPSHTSALILAESTFTLKYSEADLIKILKIFLETKGQKLRAEVLHKRLSKAKIPDIYFEKLHIDCYHFC